MKGLKNSAARDVYGREYTKPSRAALLPPNIERTQAKLKQDLENAGYDPLWPELQYQQGEPDTADRSRQSDNEERRKEAASDLSHQGRSDTTSQKASRRDSM